MYAVVKVLLAAAHAVCEANGTHTDLPMTRYIPVQSFMAAFLTFVTAATCHKDLCKGLCKGSVQNQVLG